MEPANVIVWDKCRLGMWYSWRRMYEWIGYYPMSLHVLRRKDLGDIIRVSGVGEKTHPTEKPVECVEPLIDNSTDNGGRVLDWNLGSGTTGVAAVRLGRRFIGIEIEPRYFEIAKRRIQDELRRVEFLEPKLAVERQATLFGDGER